MTIYKQQAQLPRCNMAPTRKWCVMYEAYMAHIKLTLVLTRPTFYKFLKNL
jgi:hypothetical protein